MKNYFQGNSEHIYHLSVGGVIRNEKGEIMVHHYGRSDLPGYWPDLGINDFYILMRETMNPNETLEHALHRGFMEEFGAEVELVDYIGSIQVNYLSPKNQVSMIEKTTLYFLCKLISQDTSKRDTGDIEGKTDLEWHTAEFLVPKMKEQAIKYNRPDIDESKILEML